MRVQVSVFRAADTRSDRPVPTGLIEITDPVEDPTLPPTEDWETRMRAFYQGQAQSILDVLNTCLPGGTLDALFGLMAVDRATLFRVRHEALTAREPTAGPAAGLVRVADEDLVRDA